MRVYKEYMESKTPTQDNTMTTETTTTGQALHTMQIAAIKVAVTKNPSAKLAHRDAVCCFARSDFHHARLRALDSLAHSVGIMDRSYIKALNS